LKNGIGFGRLKPIITEEFKQAYHLMEIGRDDRGKGDARNKG
jgi:hypothetical protein